MIIRLTKANFSENNIGELNKFNVNISGSKYVSHTVTPTPPIDKGANATITVTAASGTVASDFTVTMKGNSITPSITETSTGVFTITITNVTGTIGILVGEVVSGGGSGDNGSGGNDTPTTLTWYPMQESAVTASRAQMGGAYGFARSVLPDDKTRHFTKFETTFKPTKDGNFNYAILVAEFDDSDGTLLIVSKEIHTVTGAVAGDVPVSLDIDITVNPGQMIGVVAPSSYIYMTAGSTYSGSWNLVLGSASDVTNYSDFVPGQKLAKSPTTANGKIPLLFFEGVEM